MKQPISKEQLIEALYKSLKDSYPSCKETIKENLELFEKGETPQNIIWMWMEKDVEKWKALKDKYDNEVKQ